MQSPGSSAVLSSANFACFRAYGMRQRIAFSDEAPLQASFNDIDFDHPASSQICVGIGNLGLYPYSTIVAVILHELGHQYCCGSDRWDLISSMAEPKRIELLADFMAGAAFARMEPRELRLTERVDGQCDGRTGSPLGGPPGGSPTRPPPKDRVLLDPRRLARVDGRAQFFVLKDWRVEPLASAALIGAMPEEITTGGACATRHVRRLDFLALAGAVSSWRTFGDLPATESHGTASERYDAFSLGYETAAVDRDRVDDLLRTALTRGMRYLEIGK